MGNIGEKIRKIREIRNMSRKYVAFELMISTNTYGKIERDEIDITLKRLYHISKILNVGITTIIEFDENKFLDNSRAKKFL